MRDRKQTRIIKHVLPAVGWKVFEFWWNTDQNVEGDVNELPVLGFAVLEDDGELEAQLLIWDDEYKAGLLINDPIINCENTDIMILPPGKELTDELRKVGFCEVREKCERNKRHAELVAGTLYAAVE